MPDAKSILNLGLGKIAASRIVSLDPPRPPIEKHCAQGYAQWRDLELAKRDWKFAYISGYPLTSDGPALVNPTDGYRYRFALPGDFIRPLRNKDTGWDRRGSYLYSMYPALEIDYIARVSESQFDNTFIEVLACRIALECVEFTTQSNTKAQGLQIAYDDAIKIAGRLNAYITGPQDTTLLDSHSDWITARHGYWNG